MPKIVSALEITLGSRAPDQSLADWLYQELLRAMSEGRLAPGTRLPATRDFAEQHQVSRGTVVSVFERLHAEGYLASRVGAGTWVADHVPAFGNGNGRPALEEVGSRPEFVNRVLGNFHRPKAFAGLRHREIVRPFQMGEPALREFPSAIWARLAAHRSRQFSAALRSEDDGGGYRPLREAVAHYLATSRGIGCTPDEVVIVSGVQQGLDLLARFLLRPGDRVWIEDPGYFGADIAFYNAGAITAPIPVDDHGLSVTAGMARCPDARGVYLTPAHQFPLGMTMSLERRISVLDWAARQGAFILEDDYDSEYRFGGRPVPTLQSLDRHGSVIVVGSFSKLLFPALRLGYVVLPPALADHFRAFRCRTDFRSVHIDQAVLCDFINGGHLGRHIRRMRDLYAGRLHALMEGGQRYLEGMLEISGVQAGLYTAAFLRNGMQSSEAEAAATAEGVDTLALDRFTFEQPDPCGIILGFAAFDEREIQKSLLKLRTALRHRRRRRA